MVPRSDRLGDASIVPIPRASVLLRHACSASALAATRRKRKAGLAASAGRCLATRHLRNGARRRPVCDGHPAESPAFHSPHVRAAARGRTDPSSALTTPRVSSPRSAQTSCSPVAQPAPVADGKIIPTALLSRDSRAYALVPSFALNPGLRAFAGRDLLFAASRADGTACRIGRLHRHASAVGVSSLANSRCAASTRARPASVLARVFARTAPTWLRLSDASRAPAGLCGWPDLLLAW
jgi:hypothetical protein